MTLYDPNSQHTQVLGVLPSGAEDAEVIAAPKGEAPEFLVVYRSTDNHFFVVEPGSPSPL